MSEGTNERTLSELYLENEKKKNGKKNRLCCTEYKTAFLKSAEPMQQGGMYRMVNRNNYSIFSLQRTLCEQTSNEEEKKSEIKKK